jgi:hypothetical protein
MPPIRWIASLLTPLRRAFDARDRRVDEPDDLPQASPESELDVAEEFQKVQRGLRRLSLASDRGGEMLQAVSTRLDEMQQVLLRISRPQQAALTLDETELLRVLDQLDRAVGMADLPALARDLVESAKACLLSGAGWQPTAIAGAKPEGVGIRIAESVGESDNNGHPEVRIHRILEQGYRRADGTLLRPGVVIAATAPPSNACSTLT